jgi:predicted DNA-binding transcriptional regulator YafY
LIYRDAADHPHEFSIYHAKISPHDKRLYLDCWCEETTGSDDIESLRHNRCLRIDRIPTEAAITPIQGKWRSQLTQITVTFQLSGKLAFAYKPKKDDVDDIWLNDYPIRQISRTVSSTFWFYREIMPYAEDCEILEPDDVREKFKAKVRSLYLKYSSD